MWSAAELGYEKVIATRRGSPVAKLEPTPRASSAPVAFAAQRHAAVRVLLTARDERLRSSLEAPLRDAGFHVELAACAEQLLRLSCPRAVDVILLGLHADPLGLDAVGALRQRGWATAVMVLDPSNEVEARIRALNAGADGCLSSPFSLEELQSRLRSLHRRGTAQVPVTRVGELRIEHGSRRVWRQGVELKLTAREFALLEYLARRPGQVVTRTQITEDVWDMNFHSFTNVVDVYIRYLRRKIDDPFPYKLIQTHRGVGYSLRADDLAPALAQGAARATG